MSSGSRPYVSNRGNHRTIIVILVAFIYFGSYLAMSRVGQRDVKQVAGVEGYWFIRPTGPITEAMNDAFIIVYYPLILVDRMITGLGPVIGGELSE